MPLLRMSIIFLKNFTMKGPQKVKFTYKHKVVFDDYLTKTSLSRICFVWEVYLSVWVKFLESVFYLSYTWKINLCEHDRFFSFVFPNSTSNFAWFYAMQSPAWLIFLACMRVYRNKCTSQSLSCIMQDFTPFEIKD